LADAGCNTHVICGGPDYELSDARAAVEANLGTPEGKAYDQQLGNEFLKDHLSKVRPCKQSAAGDFRSFWILMKIAKPGAVEEVLLYPETKIGACSRTALLKDTFSPPPRPDYWVSVYMHVKR
jgi:hypothetical protein